MWEDDAIEAFLQPPGSEGYYHLAANSEGVRYDARATGGLDAGWNGNWQVKVGRTEGGWTVTMTIQFDTLGAKPAGLWRMNFAREEADTKQATSWAYLFGGFHTPGRFGEVKVNVER